MIIVTGSEGFIGRHFISELESEEILAVDAENREVIFQRSFDRWREVKLVLHQGAISSTTTSDLNALIEQNINYSLRLFEKCIENEIPVKYASSASVYGDKSRGLGPLSLYASSKHIIDLWVSQNLNRFSLIQGFRYFNVFGAGEGQKVAQRQASPVATFFHQALTLGEVRVFPGSDSFFRDFIWVGDLIPLVLRNDCDSGIFDLGTGEPTSFLAVAEAVAARVGVPIVEVPMPAKVAQHYQPFTRADYPWKYRFRTVGEFIEECDLDQWRF